MYSYIRSETVYDFPFDFKRAVSYLVLPRVSVEATRSVINPIIANNLFITPGGTSISQSWFKLTTHYYSEYVHLVGVERVKQTAIKLYNRNCLKNNVSRSFVG